jgi:DNA-binding beta-propeller fold protein YncE
LFDEARLVSDPAHTRLATVPVGTAPVGLSVAVHGQRIVVANSSRFGGRGGEADYGSDRIEVIPVDWLTG